MIKLGLKKKKKKREADLPNVSMRYTIKMSKYY